MRGAVELLGFPGYLPPTAPLGRRERARLEGVLGARGRGAFDA